MSELSEQEAIEARTPKGGCIARCMPPTSWHCGDIPESCYDKEKAPCDIRKELYESYLSQENVKRLVDWLEWRDGKPSEYHTLIAKMQLELLAEIDAETVWRSNNGLI